MSGPRFFAAGYVGSGMIHLRGFAFAARSYFKHHNPDLATLVPKPRANLMSPDRVGLGTGNVLKMLKR